MDHSPIKSDIGSISFTCDLKQQVSHSNDLAYPDEYAADLILSAIRIIENAISYSFLVSSDGEFELESALVVVKSLSKMMKTVKNVQTSIINHNPKLKEIDDLDSLIDSENF